MRPLFKAEHVVLNHLKQGAIALGLLLALVALWATLGQVVERTDAHARREDAAILRDYQVEEQQQAMRLAQSEDLRARQLQAAYEAGKRDGLYAVAPDGVTVALECLALRGTR